MSTPDPQLEAFDPFQSGDPEGEEPAHASQLLMLMREALVVSALAVCGLTLRITALTVDPDIWGTALPTVYALSALTTWVLIGGYVIGRLVAALRDQLGALHTLALRESEAETVTAATRAEVARARRHADGLPDSVLVREEFFPRLTRELAGVNAGTPLGLVLAHVEAASSGHEERSVVLAAAVREIQLIVRAEDLIAHLGDGLFAILLPETDAERGRRPWELLRMSLLALAEHHGGTLADAFVVATGEESAEPLYRRAVEALEPVDRPALRHAS